jgi:hypothetical protein
VIKRIFNFDKKDWKHVGFLFFNMIKQFFKGDLHESKEACYWLKFHLTYDSKRVG